MNRAWVTCLLAEMLDRLEEGAWPLNLVEEIHLFGSCVRGVLEPGDVDVVVRHTTDDRGLPLATSCGYRGRKNPGAADVLNGCRAVVTGTDRSVVVFDHTCGCSHSSRQNPRPRHLAAACQPPVFSHALAEFRYHGAGIVTGGS